MPLAPGTRLGPYEITGPLGAGGMGEVFRARDTRLDREVAVKVLPEHLSDHPEVRARFEREAKTISALNHPNICTLHDVGREGDTDYLVMELIEGETLAQRVATGALPLADVLEIGAQVADALDRAHRAGVVHRDLKPGNVMLTKSGAKLMDFGLARATVAEESAARSGVTMATMEEPLTAEGAIVGTFQYMAPEQLEGGDVDARTDLWALGCLLYEMATGRRAFEGKSQASLIGSIMGSQPAPLSQLVPLTPPGLEQLVQACLSKDPAERLQSAHDIRMQLAWLAEGGSQAGVPAPVAARRKNRTRLAAMLAVAGWLAAAAALAWLWLESPRPEGPFFATLEVSPSRPLAALRGTPGPIALSPDGTRLATVIELGGEQLVSVYEFESGDARLLEGTAGAGFPFWSPDGRWIAFFAEGKLRKVEARGGPAQVLADAFTGRGGSWSRNGVIVFAPNIHGPLMKVSENGGAVTAITRPDSDEVTHRNPYFLSDGERFLFVERRSRSTAVGRLMIGTLDGATPRELLAEASNVQISAGHLLFVRDRNLLAQHFDERSLELRGPTLPVAQGLAYWNPKDIGNFSATRAGLLVFRRAWAGQRGLAWRDRNGRLLEELARDEVGWPVAASRDLRQLAVGRRESSGQAVDLWLLDLETGQDRRATFTGAVSVVGCAFSPDGRQMAVSLLRTGTLEPGAGRPGTRGLWIQPVFGASGHQVLREEGDFTVTDWSADGKVLLGWSQRTGTSHDLTYVRLDDPAHELRELLNSRFDEIGPRFSPDGAWVAYQSDESGRSEVYVIDFPGVTRKWKVSREGGSSPRWAPDGSEIVFNNSAKVLAVSVERTADGIELGAPVELGLSEAPLTAILGTDGERFLVGQTDPAARPQPLQVVRNWSALLARPAE